MAGGPAGAGSESIPSGASCPCPGAGGGEAGPDPSLGPGPMCWGWCESLPWASLRASQTLVATSPIAQNDTPRLWDPEASQTPRGSGSPRGRREMAARLPPTGPARGRGVPSRHPLVPATPGSGASSREPVPGSQRERHPPAASPCLLRCLLHGTCGSGLAAHPCGGHHLAHELLKCRCRISLTQCPAHSRCSLNAI